MKVRVVCFLDSREGESEGQESFLADIPDKISGLERIMPNAHRLFDKSSVTIASMALALTFRSRRTMRMRLALFVSESKSGQRLIVSGV